MAMYFEQPEGIRFLERHVIRNREPVVGINGKAGMGKTTLARIFSETHSRSFASIEYRPVRTPLGSQRGADDQQMSSLPALVVFDDIDAVTANRELFEDARMDLRRSIRARSQALVVGRSIPQKLTDSRFPVFTMRLPSREQLRDALVARFGRESGVMFDEIGSEPESTRSDDLVVFAAFANAMEAGEEAGDLKRLLAPFDQHGLVDPQGRPIREGSEEHKTIINVTSAINDELIAKLAVHPELMYEIHPRKFEELVAELLERDGYEVNLTPISRDGGKDIYVAKRNTLGSFLYLVECKRYAPDKPVGIGMVQRLYGVVAAAKATAGILATTSYFSDDAMKFQETVRHQLSLQDYAAVKSWIDRGLRSRVALA